MDDKAHILYLGFRDGEEKHRRKLAGVCRFALSRDWTVDAVPPAKCGPAAVRRLSARLRPVGIVAEGSLVRGRPGSFGPEGLPVVLLDPPDATAGGGEAAVFCDNAAVAKAAFRELAAGLPSCFAGVPSHGMQRWSTERIESFRSLCASAGAACTVFPAIPVRPGRIDDDLMRRRRRLAEWIAGLPPRCAVFAANDYSAQDVVCAARAAGRAIPRELTLVGADGWGDSGGGTPITGVSSVQLDFELAGYLAAQLLADAAGAPDRRVRSFGPLCVLRHESTGGRGRRDPHVLKAVEIIRREACEGLTAAGLAARIPGSRKHFERRFREAMGHSVLDEILDVRLQTAKDLLSKAGIPIGAIADFCGFGSQVELRILFRARTGMSLRDWRRNHLGPFR